MNNLNREEIERFCQKLFIRIECLYSNIYKY